MMKFFIDTAETAEIRKHAELGMVDGVTTNPSLIAKSGRNQKEVIQEIASIVEGPISVEGIGDTAEQMVKEGLEFSKWAKNVVVKVPMTKEGLKAVRKLEAKGIPTNVTLVFSASQALLAAKAGASYVSPFVGRLDDVSQNGMELIAQIIPIFRNYGYKTQVIVASIRHPVHIIEAGLLGADICTVPPKVLEQLWDHPLTTKGIELFKKDYEKSVKK